MVRGRHRARDCGREERAGTSPIAPGRVGGAQLSLGKMHGWRFRAGGFLGWILKDVLVKKEMKFIFG